MPEPGQAAVAARPLPAFAEVYAQHASFAWRTLRRLGVREADVEDACQDVFVVVHRKLAEFAGRSALTTWIFGVCRRTASAYRRRAHLKREEPVDQLPDRPVEPAQAEEAERRQARRELDRILEGLDEEKRIAFVLYEIEDWPMAEVAAAMECPLQTAYSRLYAALAEVEAAARKRFGGGDAA